MSVFQSITRVIVDTGKRRLAVNYQFLVNDGDGERHELVVEPFNAVTEQNDYEVRRRFDLPVVHN